MDRLAVAGQSGSGEWRMFNFFGIGFAFSRDINPGPQLTNETPSAMTTVKNLLNDEAGFIVSAELALISTIAVLGLVVGLSEVSININNELEDVGSAFSAMNQGFASACTSGHKGNKGGSSFDDGCDFCSGQNDIR